MNEQTQSLCKKLQCHVGLRRMSKALRRKRRLLMSTETQREICSALSVSNSVEKLGWAERKSLSENQGESKNYCEKTPVCRVMLLLAIHNKVCAWLWEKTLRGRQRKSVKRCRSLPTMLKNGAVQYCNKKQESKLFFLILIFDLTLLTIVNSLT